MEVKNLVKELITSYIPELPDKEDDSVGIMQQDFEDGSFIQVMYQIEKVDDKRYKLSWIDVLYENEYKCQISLFPYEIASVNKIIKKWIRDYLLE